jgi:IS5 family transposase
VGIASEKKVVRGRRLRVDTTVVETNIHYPTDSSLLGDGVRVLTRTMQRLSTAVKGAGEKIRNRMRSASRRVMEIARASRSRGKSAEQKRQRAYQRLLTITGSSCTPGRGDFK